MDVSEYPPAITDLDTAIKAIRAGLQARSGKAWSVKRGTGTGYGWIRISPPPARLDGYQATEADARELCDLLGFEVRDDRWQNFRSVSVVDAGDYRTEYVDRAEGRTPRVIGSPYWD